MCTHWVVVIENPSSIYYIPLFQDNTSHLQPAEQPRFSHTTYQPCCHCIFFPEPEFCSPTTHNGLNPFFEGNYILLPKLFWPSVRKNVLVTKEGFWSSRNILWKQQMKENKNVTSFIIQPHCIWDTSNSVRFGFCDHQVIWSSFIWKLIPNEY